MKEDHPLISIIVPVHNVEKYLERCVQSILRSNYDNYEVLLIENGSTDASYEICLALEKTDSRIRAVRSEKADLSSALNIGLNMAGGTYLSMIDSDDTIEPDMLQALLGAFNSEDIGMAMCDYRKVITEGTEEREESEKHLISAHGEILSSSTFVELMHEPESKSFICCCLRMNKMYKKSLFEDYRYPEGHLHEDVWSAYRIADKAQKIKVVPQKLYNYYQNKNSIMHQKIGSSNFDEIYARIAGAEFLKSKGYDTAVISKIEDGVLRKTPRLYYEARYNGVEKSECQKFKNSYLNLLAGIKESGRKKKLNRTEFCFAHFTNLEYLRTCIYKFIKRHIH